MPVIVLRSWNGSEIAGAYSREGVFAAHDWKQMTLLPGPPIVKKAEQPSDDSAFDPELRPDLTRVLGHYSAVQSINSEDTATWSAFGTTPGQGWVRDILDAAFGSARRPPEWNVALWKTTAHPDGRGRGPEADAIIDAVGVPGRYVVEAKWLSDIGEGQGSDRSKTQIDMRFLAASENETPPDRSGVIVVAPSPSRYCAKERPVFRRYFDVRDGAYVPKMNRVALVTWEKIAQIMGGEVRKYLEWRLGFLPRT
ncbi:MAG: hypothetical protein WCG85_09785 [Polyangia bacterium]